MYYIVYKTTNKINNKIYIGIHTQIGVEFDGYLGSGLILRKAILKYGEENFHRETLFEYDNLQDSRDKERELVTEEFCIGIDNYNISVGGTGGHTTAGYTEEELDISNQKRNLSLRLSWIANLTEEKLEQYRTNFKKIRIQPDNSGMVHSEQSCLNMSNGRLGLMHVTNGIDNKMVFESELLPDGWYMGRTLTETQKFKGHTPETAKSMGKRRLGKKYYNNGIENILCKENEQPEGWVNGLLRHKKTKTIWITNGVVERKIECGLEIHNGWTRGRLGWKRIK